MRLPVALATLLVLAACSGSSGSPLKRAADVDPKLEPATVPAGLKLHTTVSRSFYTLDWSDATRSIELSVRIATLPPGTDDVREFRHDKHATYRVTGDDRELVWQEPGHWTSHVAGAPTNAVPFDLRTHGIADDEFWTIARSMHEVS